MVMQPTLRSIGAKDLSDSLIRTTRPKERMPIKRSSKILAVSSRIPSSKLWSKLQYSIPSLPVGGSEFGLQAAIWKAFMTDEEHIITNQKEFPANSFT
eukprot:scaffold126345_cov24-Prasinocladus_malaysianus.AAC.1